MTRNCVTRDASWEREPRIPLVQCKLRGDIEYALCGTCSQWGGKVWGPLAHRAVLQQQSTAHHSCPFTDEQIWVLWPKWGSQGFTWTQWHIGKLVLYRAAGSPTVLLNAPWIETTVLNTQPFTSALRPFYNKTTMHHLCIDTMCDCMCSFFPKCKTKPVISQCNETLAGPC